MLAPIYYTFLNISKLNRAKAFYIDTNWYYGYNHIQTMVSNYSLYICFRRQYVNKKVSQGNKTKQRIIECARKLFVEKGYNNVTVDEIIDEANSSKGGFYNHFKTKEDLIYNMVPLVDEVYVDFFKLNNNNQNTMEKITAFISYVFSIMEHEIGLEFLSVIYSSQIKDLNTVRFLTSPEREYYNRLKLLINEARENKEICSDLSADEITAILTTCIRGVLYDWCLKKGSFQLTDYGMKLINMILNQVKAQSGS